MIPDLRVQKEFPVTNAAIINKKKCVFSLIKFHFIIKCDFFKALYVITIYLQDFDL